MPDVKGCYLDFYPNLRLKFFFKMAELRAVSFVKFATLSRSGWTQIPNADFHHLSNHFYVRQLCWLVADLILTYKIIFGLVDIDPNDYFCLKGSDSTRLRGNPYKITVNHCRLNVHRNFLVSVSAYCCSLNSLPPIAWLILRHYMFRKTVTNANLKLFTKY